MKHNKRQIAEKKGRKAENLAVWWFRLQGYRIIARREKTPKGEIDIIAVRGKTLVFVEVKARADFQRGIQAIAPYQIRRIIAAARYWRSTTKNQQNHVYRFDIVLVKPYLLIKHIKNAFDETGRAI
ncbi:MAG TPA: YraN family protein [Rhizobiales bacterium]|nr:YraN family protein [Hyphomicrobiales bacterium]